MTKGNDPIYPIMAGQSYTDQRGDMFTKREYFAAMAMQGLISRVGSTAGYEVAEESGEAYHTIIATVSVRFADSLIEALNKCKT